MEEWNELLRLFGGEKYTAVNPQGLRRYRHGASPRHEDAVNISTGHFQPQTRISPGVARPVYSARVALARSGAPPQARAGAPYVFARIFVSSRIRLDGLTTTRTQAALRQSEQATQDEVLAFEETQHRRCSRGPVRPHHSEVKRAGIVQAHDLVAHSQMAKLGITSGLAKVPEPTRSRGM